MSDIQTYRQLNSGGNLKQQKMLHRRL